MLRSVLFRLVLAASLALGLWRPTGALAEGGLAVTATPGLSPGFAADVSDYAVRCNGGKVSVTFDPPPGMSVSVDGGPPQTGFSGTDEALAAGEGFVFTTAEGAVTRTYHVRCLPSDFPPFTAQRTRTPQAEWYVVAPFSEASFAPPPPAVSTRYVAIFDGHGAPVWWLDGGAPTVDAKLLTNGNLIWSHAAAGSEEHRFDGSLVRTVNTVGVVSDSHDVQLLADGDYLLLSYDPRAGVDLTGIGGPPDGTIQDAVVQEVTPAGALVWSWRASDHIPVAEVPARWSGTIIANASPYDVYHMNSVDAVGNSLVLSFRHLDAVYEIDKATGAVQWKLGGTSRAESLTVSDDPVFTAGGSIGGQHDARILPDGSLTLFDNATNLGRPARDVRYQIDVATHTAKLLEQVIDPAKLLALCCGSTRRLSGGNFVTSWGSNSLVSELTPSGARAFRLTFGGLFTYRVDPVEPGVLDAGTLRDGMDAQRPHTPQPGPMSLPSPEPSVTASPSPEPTAATTSTPTVDPSATATPTPTPAPADQTCRSRHGLADRVCTPGDARAGVTRADVCRTHHRYRVGALSAAQRRRAFQRYDVPRARRDEFQIDRLIAIGLGGTNRPANLWPQRLAPQPGAAAKNRVEARLHSRVCAGVQTLQTAQRRMIRRWSRPPA